MEEFSPAFQKMAIELSAAKSETLRREIRRIRAADSPHILRRLSRDRAESYLKIMQEVGAISERIYHAAVIWIEHEYIKQMPQTWRDW